jgi:hypothetical protein
VAEHPDNTGTSSPKRLVNAIDLTRMAGGTADNPQPGQPPTPADVLDPAPADDAGESQ